MKTRREFLKYGTGGIGALVLGPQLAALLSGCGGGGGSASPSGGGDPPPPPPTQELNFRITDARKQMVTHNAVNNATCYFWIYADATGQIAPDCPGPQIIALEGDKVRITLTNQLDENHAFAISKGGQDPAAWGTSPSSSFVFQTGPIGPGETRTFEFTVPGGGTYLYYDNLNEPVNRVMGLHGAFIVMPKSVLTDVQSSPYSSPTNAVRQLFNDFGTTAHWPGLAWGQGDAATNTPVFRQHIWLCSEASPVLFAEVGNFTPGQDYPAAQFVDRYLNDPYADTFNTGVFNRKAHFFTINGQSGHFVHNNPHLTPMYRVGEPCIIRALGAGLHEHSLHIHANHVYVTSFNGRVGESALPSQDNPIWVDTYFLHPLDIFDYTVPFMRPPDIPNARGIGRPDAPLAVNAPAINDGRGPGGGPVPAGVSTWPPIQELNTFIPPVGTVITDLATGLQTDISVQLSPLCFPMHSHSEASQSAQGGNYNCGLIAGINFTGDRNTPGGVTTFPNAPTVHGPDRTGPPAPEHSH
jgi:hypothetical protein